MRPILWDESVPQAADQQEPELLWSWYAAPSVVTGSYPVGTAEIVITISDGERIAASMLEGHFLAWWPDRDQVIRVEGIDADGSVFATWSGQD